MARKKKGWGSDDGGSSIEIPPDIDSPEQPTGGDAPGNVVPFKKGKGGGGEAGTFWDKEPKRLAALNGEYCLVMEGGRTWVLKFEERALTRRGRSVPVYMRKSDFEMFHQNQKVVRPALRGGGIVEIPEGEWWLDHPKRRQYKAVVSIPQGRGSSTASSTCGGLGCGG